MTKRVLDISDESMRLRVSHGSLLLKRTNADVRIAFEDIGVLIVSHPQVTYSQAVLSGLVESGGVFIACNSNHVPVGMMFPVAGNKIQVSRFAVQADAKMPTKKRLWKQIVQSKIRSQARLLLMRYDNDYGLMNLVDEVKSGDPGNIEAQAARRYWKSLFPSRVFRRDRDAEDENLLLNYGYTVLRAIVGRGICAAGLHPSLGLHHHNRGSIYCLADDLMEPLRAVVDLAVLEHGQMNSSPCRLEKPTKQFVLERLLGKHRFSGEQHNLFEISLRMASSLVNVFEGKARMLTLPEV